MRLWKSIIFIFSVLVMLGIISLLFPQPHIKIGNISLHFPSIEEILHGDKKDTIISAEEMLSISEKTLNIDSVLSKIDIKDEVEKDDSLCFYSHFFNQSPSRLYFPENDSTYLFSLFKSLKNAANNSVHIMHYGDSQIEGDRITGDLRQMFQKKFGGNGPGLIPLYQPIPTSSYQQQLSDSIRMYYAGGMMGKRSTDSKYGAMAQVAKLDRKDTLRVNIKSRAGKSLTRAVIYAGEVDSFLHVGMKNQVGKFAKANGIQKIEMSEPKRTDNIEISFCGRGNIYGINLSSETGVSVSNIPLRGSDGTFFSRIDREAMQYMLSQMNTQLVIMEFGGNALPAMKDSAAVERWCRYFGQQVGYMSRMLPKSKIIVIGPADMAVKTDGELHTHPLLPYLTEKMCETTTHFGAAFWNMFLVMGGKDSMPVWVDHKPAWAAPDYVHFTRKGANRISEILCETIMVYYNYWQYIGGEE